ncbi:hypothetical protein P9D98_06680 [Bacillus mojavensis]|nr:hypothetical protein [Bacillus mojavensis]MEC1634381.1 hypothetical protein [Bacillus mojavensis]
MVGIPHQIEPWVIHACGNEFDSDQYSNYLEKFFREYFKS